jgi:hypothetical protein
MGKKNKAKSWEEIDCKTREKLIELRILEKEYLDKSGYVRWKKSFAKGYITYALVYYMIYARKHTISPKVLTFLFLPAIPYGYLLLKMYFNLDYYKLYYKNHIELNRLIKKTSKSSEYK